MCVRACLFACLQKFPDLPYHVQAGWKQDSWWSACLHYNWCAAVADVSLLSDGAYSHWCDVSLGEMADRPSVQMLLGCSAGCSCVFQLVVHQGPTAACESYVFVAISASKVHLFIPMMMMMMMHYNLCQQCQSSFVWCLNCCLCYWHCCCCYFWGAPSCMRQHQHMASIGLRFILIKLAVLACLFVLLIHWQLLLAFRWCFFLLVMARTHPSVSIQKGDTICLVCAPILLLGNELLALIVWWR